MKTNHISKSIRRSIQTLWVIVVILAGNFLQGCKKFVEIQPITSITAAAVYTNNNSAAAAMTGIYSNMISRQGGLTDGYQSISFLQGLASDELTNYNSGEGALQTFYQNALSSNTNGGSNYYYWSEIYNEIHAANAVIEGLAQYQGVTPALKQQLTGEALFMRAFLHFYAASLYGNVPLVTTTNYLTNNQIGQTTKQNVYLQVIQDLLQAQNDLSDNFVNQTGLTTTERIRPNKGAATALLARAYLYAGDWQHAKDAATTVITNNSYSLDADLTQVFLANSTESIWQLNPAISNTGNTQDAYWFVLTSPPGADPSDVALSPNLVNAFETGDQRLVNWVGQYSSGGQTWYYPFKYKVYQQNQPSTEYLMVLRLAEQYLIRAEAESELGDQGSAINDLNIIRNRAGLANYVGATTQAPVLAAILHERRVELFTEWGHRWFDLIRTGNINSVMGNPGGVCAAKGGTWSPSWALLPLPFGDLQIDPNLKQNPGY